MQYITTLLRDIKFAVQLARAGSDINNPAYRRVRVGVLHFFINRLRAAMKRTDFRQSILVTPDEDFIVFDGVTMKTVNRFLKSTGPGTLSQGKKMFDFLSSKGVEVSTVIDLGANWGEVSLHFSKMSSHCKILAVEASSDNFKILEKNCQVQQFNTDNIIRLNEAVSDTKGTVQISKGKSAENTILKDYWQNTPTEAVACDTLSSFIARFNFHAVDFIKIDIEGAEPMLYESLKKHIDKIGSLLIEVGTKNTHEAYVPLLQLLWNSNMRCFEDASGKEISSFQDIKKYILKDEAGAVSTDLWFIKKNIITK